MLRYTVVLALLAATVSLCSAGLVPGGIEEVSHYSADPVPDEIEKFARSLKLLTDQESAMLDAWVGNLILQQKQNGEGGLPIIFSNSKLQDLDTSVINLPLGWIKNGQEAATHDEIQSMIVTPCKDILSKLKPAADVYRELEDGAYLYGLVYVDICKSVVENAELLEGRIAKGAADDAQEKAEAIFKEPIEDSLGNLQLDPEPLPSESEVVDQEDKSVEAAVHEPATQVKTEQPETSSATSPAAALAAVESPPNEETELV